MTILDQYTDMAGKLRLNCQTSTGVILSLKFDHQPTEAELSVIESQYIENHQYDSVVTVAFNLLDHVELLKEFITLVKANPSVTLAQYNNWLATKSWYQSAIIRYFVFSLATILSNRKDVSLSSMTESEVLGKLRDWIVATNIRAIAKTIGYANY